MANPNFSDSNSARGLFSPNRSRSLAALFGVGLVIGSLPGVVEALPNSSRNPRINEGNVPAFVDAASGSVNQQVEDFSFVKEPVIAGDRVIGIGDVGGRLALLEGAPGEGNTFYFIEKGAVNNENIHYLAVAPKSNGRIAILADSGFYFSDNNWQTNVNFGSPGVDSHNVESVRFSDDGRLVFMDIEREGQRNTAVFNPEAIPQFQALDGDYPSIRSSQPSTPRLQPEGTYADYRMEKIGSGWKLRKHTYDLSMGQEISEDTPLGFRFNEGLVQILYDYITVRGGLRIGLIGPWALSNEARRVEITSYYEVNPERGEILYSNIT